MKKLVSLFLALALCLGMGAAALADGGVELPDVVGYLSLWLEDYGVTVELVKQDGFGTMIGIENVQDVQTVRDKVRDGLDLMFQLSGFQQIDREALGAGPSEREHLYAYTGSASVGTVQDSMGIEGNVYVDLSDDVDLVDGLAVVILMGDGISMKSSDTGTVAETAAETDVSSSGDNILPDAWAFFNEEVNHSDQIETNGRSAHFSLASEDRAACYAYIDLLLSGRFGLTLTDTWEKSYGGSAKTVYYVFDCPGTGADKEITRSLDDRNVSADLTVKIEDWQNVGWCEMYIHFSDALTVADTGDRCTVTDLTEWYPQDSAGPMGSAASEPDSSSSGGGGSYYDYDDDDDIYSYGSERKKCNYCNGHGSRTCGTCNGKGYIEEYISVPNYSGSTLGPMGGWEHHDCPNINCDHGQVDCGFCGGDGWID